MSERMPIDTDTIRPHLRPTSAEFDYQESQGRRAAQAGFSPTASAGDLVQAIPSIRDGIIKSSEQFITTKKLEGSERRLNKATLVYVESLHLPVDSSPDGINAFVDDHGVTKELGRRVGFIAINEPGLPIFRPIKTELKGLFIPRSSDHLAVQGLMRYLNSKEGIHGLDESPEEMAEIITKTRVRMDEHRRRILDNYSLEDYR